MILRGLSNKEKKQNPKDNAGRIKTIERYKLA